MADSLVLAAISLERPAFDAITAWGMVALALGMAAAWTGLLARRDRAHGVAAVIFFSAVALVNIVGDSQAWFTRLDLLPPPFVVMNFVILSVVL
jgi:hypothetical protein